ncbi:MAG: hypothetical protein H6540_04610 [Bacteroidales bacterium]|nr:hypothetical protein [Bacteroidales bacterium]MCB9012402.1 hypothetical protein [Bacteroidales bacterium]
MNKPKHIIQNTFPIDGGQTLENFMVLTFTEGNQTKTIMVRFPEWWRYWDRDYKYYIFSRN